MFSYLLLNPSKSKQALGAGEAGFDLGREPQGLGLLVLELQEAFL